MFIVKCDFCHKPITEPDAQGVKLMVYKLNAKGKSYMSSSVQEFEVHIVCLAKAEQLGE